MMFTLKLTQLAWIFLEIIIFAPSYLSYSRHLILSIPFIFAQALGLCVCMFMFIYDQIKQMHLVKLVSPNTVTLIYHCFSNPILGTDMIKNFLKIKITKAYVWHSYANGCIRYILFRITLNASRQLSRSSAQMYIYVNSIMNYISAPDQLILSKYKHMIHHVLSLKYKFPIIPKFWFVLALNLFI